MVSYQMTHKPIKLSFYFVAFFSSLIYSSLLSVHAEGRQDDYQYMYGGSNERPVALESQKNVKILGIFFYYNKKSIRVQRIPDAGIDGIRLDIANKFYLDNPRQVTDFVAIPGIILICNPSSPWKAQKKAYWIGTSTLKIGALPAYVPEGLADEKCADKWLGLIK